MATTNCSYINSSNTYQELLCVASEYCCTSSQSNTCSAVACSTANSNSSSSTISPTLFWSILGGLFGAGVILIFLMYIICKFRTPNSCLSDQQQSEAEMFEEECHEINTVSHQPTRRHSRFYFRRESFWKITRRKSSNSRTVCTRCEKKQEKNNEAHKDDMEMKNNITIIKNVAQQKNTKNINISPLPDVG